MIPLEEAIGPAREAAGKFLQGFDLSDRLVIFCHFDADGLAAGALWGRGLARLGFRDVQVVPSMRGEWGFSNQAKKRLAALEPAGLIVTDLGVHRAGLLPGVPAMYVDHHQPAGIPREATIILGYDWEPIPCSAWLADDLLAPLADVDDLTWIAAIGILSDLGDSAPWPRMAAAKKRYTAKWLREAVTLINAARRSSAFDIATPLRMLLEATDPKEISQNRSLGADRLHRYRAEVNAELAEARRRAPIFSRSQPFALVKLDSPCQIHPLIAQQWRTRPPKYAVIAANSGYLPGVVAFSMRTSRDDLNLPQLLQGLDLGVDGASFGYGHDQASGGQVPPAVFNRLLRALDFAEDAFVEASAA